MAAPFDARAMQVRGPARQLPERVAASEVGTAVTMSPGGTLVYQPSGAKGSRLMLSDTGGHATPLGSWVRAFGEARFSPDGKRVAVGIAQGEEGEGLWVIDRASAEATRVGGAEDAGLVDWTRDARALITLRRDEIWSTPVDGSHTASRLVRVEGSGGWGAAMAPDGHSVIVARSLGGSTTQELVRVPLDPGQPIVTVVPSRSSGGSLRPGYPRISPDGKWMAFVDHSVYEVHVRSISGAEGIQVSNEGGRYAVWGAREGQLVYGTLEGLVEADLQTTPTLTVRRRQRLDAWSSLGWLFDISSDGKTLLISQPTTEGVQPLVALNWGASLRRQVQGRESSP
jgi:hypothetical protein